MTTTANPFREQLAKNISAKITLLKKEGTTGMGLANLCMVTPTPHLIDGAPGSPAAYRIMFREVAMAKPITRRFLLTTEF